MVGEGGGDEKRQQHRKCLSPKKNVKNPTASILSAGQEGAAKESAGEKGRAQYKQNQARVRIQECRGFTVPAAAILPLPLAAYGCMQGRSQASETKHCLEAGPAELQQPRQSRTWQGISKSSSSCHSRDASGQMGSKMRGVKLSRG